jgi:hypothetical protein
MIARKQLRRSSARARVAQAIPHWLNVTGSGPIRRVAVSTRECRADGSDSAYAAPGFKGYVPRRVSASRRISARSSGKIQETPAAFVFTFDGDKVKESRRYFDSMTLLKQIGAQLK